MKVLRVIPWLLLGASPALAAVAEAPLEIPALEAPARLPVAPVAYVGGIATLLPVEAAAWRSQLTLETARISQAVAALNGAPVPPVLSQALRAGTELESALQAASALRSTAAAPERTRTLEALLSRCTAWRAATQDPKYRAFAGAPASGPSSGEAAAEAVRARVEEFQSAISGSAREAANDPAFAERPLKSPEEMDAAWKQLEPGLARGLKADYDRAYREAYFDSLTGLHSRKYLDHHVEALAAEPHYQLMGDVDHFKSVNDTFGHLTGDLTLRAVAQIWGEELAKVGEIGVRWGGEEYWGRVRGGLEQALTVARRINERVRAEVGPGVAIPRPVTISVGVSHYEPSASQTPRESFMGAMNAADGALYYSKRNGRDLVVLEEDRAFKPLSGSGLSRLTPPPPAASAPAPAWRRLRDWLAGLLR